MIDLHTTDTFIFPQGWSYVLSLTHVTACFSECHVASHGIGLKVVFFTFNGMTPQDVMCGDFASGGWKHVTCFCPRSQDITSGSMP